jgi:hypothetical protein
METVLEEFDIDEKALSIGYDTANMDEVSLLFQTGYLTIKKMKLIDGFVRYTLDFPNAEVHESFLTSLLKAHGVSFNINVDKLRKTMEQQIATCDEAGFNRSLESMMATIPYELRRNNEAHYHVMLLIWMRLLGFKIQGEVSNNLGSVDAVWTQPDLTVVAEIKYHTTKKIDTLLNAAMSQIYERRYYNRYPGKIILLGIAFTNENAGCKMEIMNNKS